MKSKSIGKNRLFVGDCLEILPKLPAGSADLVFADPPFNVGHPYDEYDDSRPRGEYLQWTADWLAAVERILSPSGSLFVAIGDEFAAEVKIRLDALGLTMRNWIIWHYTFGVACTKKFSRSHVHILYYVADPNRFTFHADAVRVPSARTAYGDRRANPAGKLPDDTWILQPGLEASAFPPGADSWLESRVCGTFRERTAHPCQMPEAVLERIIAATSNAGDLVVDPFAGSGTTLAVAKRMGRRFQGIEISEKYAEGIWKRISYGTGTDAAE